MGFVSKVCSIGAGLVLVGCISNPATGVAASGEMLKVQYSSGTGTYVSNDVVSTTVHKDSDGNEVGSSDTYQEREHQFQWQDWKYFQGREELDEQDFYRIAGDQEAADKIEKHRASASKKMRIGVPIAVAGLVASIALTVIGTSTDKPSLTTIGYLGGSTATSVGGLVWYWGAADMKKAHLLPQSRADKNADVIEDCNEGRCRRSRGGHLQTRGVSLVR